MEIHGQLVSEQEVQEFEVEEVLTGRKIRSRSDN